MAKKQLDMTGMFTQTEPPKTETDKLDKIKPVGIGLKLSEWQRIEDIAAELGVNRHALGAWVLRDFLTRWEGGYRPQTETETKTVLK